MTNAHVMKIGRKRVAHVPHNKIAKRYAAKAVRAQGKKDAKA